MAWLIQRRAPQEPNAVYGQNGVWIMARHGEQIPRVPPAAAVYHELDTAHQIADWLRLNQPLAPGEVIALVDAPEAA